MNARKTISALLALALCSTATGASVPRLFPEGITAGSSGSTARNLTVNGAMSSTKSVEVRGTNISDEVNKGVIDFHSGATRILSYGSATTVPGTFVIRLRDAAPNTIDREVLSIATTGAVTLGSSSAGNTVHTVQSDGITTFSVKSSSTAVARVQLSDGINNDIYLRRDGGASSGFTILSDATELAKSTAAGAWTLGPSSGLTGAHVIRNASVVAAPVLSLQKTDIAPGTYNTEYLYFAGSTGSLDGYIANNGSAVLSLFDISDRRKKTNIRDASYGLSTILSLHPVEFDWMDSAVKNVKGFIAQEVAQVLPDAVSYRDETSSGGFADAHYLETQTMIPVLVKAVQEQQKQIECLVEADNKAQRRACVKK